MKSSRGVMLVFLLVGVVLLIVGFSVRASHEKLVDEGATVTGTVVSVSQSTDSDGDTTYAPIYEYRYEGAPYRHESSVSSSSRPTVGSTETMFVDRAEPSHAMADTFLERHFVPTLLLGIGALCIAIVLTASLVGFRRSRATASALEGPVATPTMPATSFDTSSSASTGPFMSGRSKSDSRGPFL